MKCFKEKNNAARFSSTGINWKLQYQIVERFQEKSWSFCDRHVWVWYYARNITIKSSVTFLLSVLAHWLITNQGEFVTENFSCQTSRYEKSQQPFKQLHLFLITLNFSPSQTNNLLKKANLFFLKTNGSICEQNHMAQIYLSPTCFLISKCLATPSKNCNVLNFSPWQESIYHEQQHPPPQVLATFQQPVYVNEPVHSAAVTSPPSPCQPYIADMFADEIYGLLSYEVLGPVILYAVQNQHGLTGRKAPVLLVQNILNKMSHSRADMPST